MPSATQYVSPDLPSFDAWLVPDGPGGIHNAGGEFASLIFRREVTDHASSVAWIT